MHAAHTWITPNPIHCVPLTPFPITNNSAHQATSSTSPTYVSRLCTPSNVFHKKSLNLFPHDTALNAPLIISPAFYQTTWLLVQPQASISSKKFRSLNRYLVLRLAQAQAWLSQTSPDFKLDFSTQPKTRHTFPLSPFSPCLALQPSRLAPRG